MGRSLPKPLPDFTVARLLDRVAEAVRVGLEPDRLADFPLWTQRVMRILKAQLVPPEFAALLRHDGAILAEGVAVALSAGAHAGGSEAGARSGRFARELADRLSLDGQARDVAIQVESGSIAARADFRQHIASRLLDGEPAARRAFIEGLAMGARLPQLLDEQAQRGVTDATGIYLTLWLYWPEISRLRSVGEVARVLAPFVAANKNLAGAHWEERIRKLANRLGLSFQAARP